jgi:drug/metabolite transporter (DMT)-like permease
VLAVVIALAASVTWGVGDFLGGLKARVLPALVVIACSQPFGLVALAAAVAAQGHPFPDARVSWAVFGAAAGTIGLAAFYRGLAAGAMAVVAPIAGAASAVPVVAGLLTGEHPGALRELGIVLAIAGVVVTSREPRADGTRLAAGAGWGLLAMAAWGAYYLPLRAASHEDFLWASLVFRITSVSLVWLAILVLRPSLRGVRANLGVLVLIGLFDTGGNVLFAAATREGLISVVSVLASLYPVVTVLLARVALGERIAKVQEAGVVLTLAGVALISTG